MASRLYGEYDASRDLSTEPYSGVSFQALKVLSQPKETMEHTNPPALGSPRQRTWKNRPEGLRYRTHYRDRQHAVPNPSVWLCRSRGLHSELHFRCSMRFVLSNETFRRPSSVCNPEIPRTCWECLCSLQHIGTHRLGSSLCWPQTR